MKADIKRKIESVRKNDRTSPLAAASAEERKS